MRQSRQRVFYRNRLVNWRYASESGCFRHSIREITRHLLVQVAPSRAASAIPLAMEYRPTFTGCTNPSHASKARSRDSRHPLLDSSEAVKASYVALSTEQRHGCVDTVDTSTLVTQTRYKKPRDKSVLPMSSTLSFRLELIRRPIRHLRGVEGRTPEAWTYRLSVPL